MRTFLKSNWLLIVILLLASFLRLYRIADYMEFLGDQGRDVVIVRDLLKNANLIFIGPQTSIGNMYLGPFYYYLIAPSLFIAGFNPIGPAIFVAILGVLTVFMVYFVSGKWFNRNTALIAAFLYAISPVVIKYSNFSWNPNIMPLFSLLLVYFMVERRYLLASLSFIMALNSHYLALILLPLTALIWLYNLKTYPQEIKKQIKNTLIAVLIFFISLIPQFLFDFKHQGQLSQAFINFFTYRETTVNLKAYKSIPQIPLLFNQVNTRLLAGKNLKLGPIISLVLFLGITVYLSRKIYKRQAVNPFLLLIILWYSTGLVGLGLYKQHIYDHYFAFLFPAVFMLIAFTINYLGRILGTLLLIVITVFSLLENPFRWSPPSQLKTTASIVKSIEERSAGKPFNFTLLAKTNYDPGYRYFFYENKLPLLNLDQKITDQLFVVCEPHPEIDCQPINHPEWGIAAFGWAKIDAQWDKGPIKIYKLVHTDETIK